MLIYRCNYAGCNRVIYISFNSPFSYLVFEVDTIRSSKNFLFTNNKNFIKLAIFSPDNERGFKKHSKQRIKFYIKYKINIICLYLLLKLCLPPICFVFLSLFTYIIRMTNLNDVTTTTTIFFRVKRLRVKRRNCTECMLLGI